MSTYWPAPQAPSYVCYGTEPHIGFEQCLSWVSHHLSHTQNSVSAPLPSFEETRARILDGHHPDVLIIEPRDKGARNIQVETIRSLVVPFAHVAPTQGKHAFIIFKNAGVSLSPNYAAACNALLKTVEEARTGLHFVFVCRASSDILRTLSSRSHPIRTYALKQQLINTLDQESATQLDNDLDTLLQALAQGHIDTLIHRAEAWAKDDRLETYIKALAECIHQAWRLTHSTKPKSTTGNKPHTQSLQTCLHLFQTFNPDEPKHTKAVEQWIHAPRNLEHAWKEGVQYGGMELKLHAFFFELAAATADLTK